MTTVKKLLAKEKRASEKLGKIAQQIEAARARRRIPCQCGKTHALRDLTLIITHWYVEPHGCTGGDYWKEGEWNFLAPCGQRGRFLFDDWKVPYKDRDKVDVAALPTFQALYRSVFKETVQEHDDKHEGKSSFNCYFLDHHRERFELPPKPRPLCPGYEPASRVSTNCRHCGGAPGEHK